MNQRIMPDKNSLNQKAWMRFKRNKVAVFGLLVIIAAFLMAVFAYQIAPDHTPDANEQMLQLEMSPPLTRTILFNLRKPINESRDKNYFQHFFFGTPSLYESMPVVSYKM